MKDFLEIVAQDLLQRTGNDLSHTIVIFPNKRANLFFNEYLTPHDGSPVWSPRYMSVGELFSSFSSKQIVDPIEAVCRLYNQYVKHIAPPKPSLDFFYGWGERLLADFDDIDKSMVDARKLFRDIYDYASLDDYDFLDEEQVRQLKRFASDFSKEKMTGVRENFNKLWSIAFEVYEAFRNELAQEGLAYEGQLFREVVEQLQQGGTEVYPDIEHIAFVGFNVIDGVERELFKYLQKEGKALFYWDYDTWYVKEDGSVKNEAGRFLQENLKMFPNALEECEAFFHNFTKDRQDKSLQYVSAPTNTAQAQSVSEWLKNPANFSSQRANRTAVVVCDENLLQVVIHSLPDNIKEVNVTKGFPLGHTPAFTCILKVISEFEKAPATDTPTLLREMQSKVREEAAKMDKLSLNDKWLHELYTEAFFQAYTVIARFIRLVNDHLLDVRQSTLFGLIKQVLRGISIPFHGEPAEGLQVMGVLETRCLDFDHIVMLSVNEGILPRKAGEASFIPYLLRKQYGLTTPERQNSVFAYYFYRLIQRAKDVRLVYNNSTEGGNRGEMSRFMKALLVEAPSEMKIENLSLTSIPHSLEIPTVKEARNLSAPKAKKEFAFSPSALKYYMKCELQYYYHYILKLKKPQKQDSIINANDFGTAFHSAAEHLFLNVLGGDKGVITPQTIEGFLKDGGRAKLQEITEAAFRDNHIESSQITRLAVMNYLAKLLKYEAGAHNHAPAASLWNVEAEKESDIVLSVPYENGTADVKLYGFIDRRDEAELPDHTKCMRIIDYKTGKKREKDNLTLDDLFAGNKDYPENPLQAFIYALMWCKKTNIPVVPMLYYVPSMSGKGFTPYINIDGNPVMDFREVAGDFEQRLIEKLAEIIDPNHSFKATTVKEHCKFCDYKDICGQ